MSNAFSKIPAGLLVKYSDVQNVINAKMNKLSRKDVSDQKSVYQWTEELLNDRFYSVKYEVSPHLDGPFLVSWMSPWQRMVCFFLCIFYVFSESTDICIIIIDLRISRRVVH